MTSIEERADRFARKLRPPKPEQKPDTRPTDAKVAEVLSKYMIDARRRYKKGSA